MTLGELRQDIKRKIKQYGTATVTWGTIKQTIRPIPNDLHAAGLVIIQGQPMDVRVDSDTDMLVFTKDESKFSAEESERYWG